MGSGLIEEEYSMPFVNLLGYTVSDMEELIIKFRNFDIQQSMYTKSYINNVLDTINKVRSGSNGSNLDKNTNYSKFLENLIVKDKFGNDAIKFKCQVWEERWFENDCLYKKSYTQLSDLELCNRSL